MTDSNNTEYWLRQRIIQLEEELLAERDAHNRTLDLLMSGEALREKLMITAILSGAFNPKPDKSTDDAWITAKAIEEDGSLV
jgi:hypothetical protein